MINFLFVCLVLCSNIIQGITGFAGTVLAMPFTILLFGMDVAKPVLTVLTSLACLLVVCRDWKEICWSEFRKMFFLMFAGVFIGEQIFRMAPLQILLPIYAFFIIAIAVKGILVKKRLPIPSGIYPLIILTAGMIHGMFISGGPLLIVYAVSKIPDKQQFRTTLSLIWLSLNIYLILRQVNDGLFTSNAIHILVLALPALFLGVFIGNRLAKKMSQETFLKLTYFLLLISGCSLLF